MALTLCSRVAFAHECADPGGSNNSGHQNCQDNYRSCGSSGHSRKLYLERYEMCKLRQGFPQLPLTEPRLAVATAGQGECRVSLHKSTETD